MAGELRRRRGGRGHGVEAVGLSSHSFACTYVCAFVVFAMTMVLPVFCVIAHAHGHVPADMSAPASSRELTLPESLAGKARALLAAELEGEDVDVAAEDGDDLDAETAALEEEAAAADAKAIAEAEEEEKKLNLSEAESAAVAAATAAARRRAQLARAKARSEKIAQMQKHSLLQPVVHGADKQSAPDDNGQHEIDESQSQADLGDARARRDREWTRTRARAHAGMK